MRSNKSNSLKLFKKILLIGIALLVLLWASMVLIGQYKIYSTEKRYYRNYVKIQEYDFSKYKQNASISVLIENKGKRLLDSISIKIDYYNDKDELLGSDLADVLDMADDVLYPETGKVFRVDVTCPEETASIKLKIE